MVSWDEFSYTGRHERTRAELDGLVLASFDATFDALGRPKDERPDLGREYLDAVDRLGLVT